MNQKTIPKEVLEVYLSAKREIDLKLAETETTAKSIHAKSFDVVVGAMEDTNTLISGFVKDKSKGLKDSILHCDETTRSVKQVLQEIAIMQNKLNGMEKPAKELNLFKEHCANEMAAELAN
jgi:predicted transcriptional regulator